MLKNQRLWTLALVALLWTQAPAQPGSGATNGKNAITLEDIWARGRFIPEFPSEFNWMKDDHFYSVLEEGKIERYSLESRSKVGTILDSTPIKDEDTGKSLEVEAYSFSDDEQLVLLMQNVEPIYRHSSREVSYVYDLRNKRLHKLHDGQPVSFATFSPDGSRIAYMHKNDLYCLVFATNTTERITKDGEWNKIINGGTDWVYEEEFAFTRAFFWSPDSKKLAFYRFDESKVREFSMDMYGDLYPNAYKFKYPKAGEANAEIEVYLHDLTTGKKVKADIGGVRDQYIPRMNWTKSSSQLAVMRMNRLQNLVEVLLVDANTGSSKVILSETEETYVEQPSDKTWIFLDNGKEFLWQSESNGYNHVYLYNLDGQRVRAVTSGNFDVTDIAAIDEKKGLLYYMSTEDSPMERHLYEIDLEGKKKKRLTKTAGWHDITFSSANNYYMDSHSSAMDPGAAALYDRKGKEVHVLADNKKLRTTMADYALGGTEFFSFKAGSETLNGWMIKPPNFDAGKKYPVLMHVYGGPGSQTVKNQWGGFNYFWHQLLAEQGYIIVSIDNRGTGGRGEAFKKVTYGQLGKYEAEDQIAGAKYLGTLPYVDANRIGIWGWSFGGYMTSLCLTKGGGVFKMGIAVAPVTSWRYYDTIYTERYLKTPQLNPSGYDDNSPIRFASSLQGKYLLVHGTADDNVHFQNSLEWTDALVKANKQFDMAFYPNKNHGIYGGTTRLHLYRKMTDFITANL